MMTTPLAKTRRKRMLCFFALALGFPVACTAVDGAAHISPVATEASFTSTSAVNLIDVSGLGEGYGFYDYDELVIQMTPTTPQWTIRNNQMSNNLFTGVSNDENIDVSLYRFQSDDGTDTFIVGTVRDTKKRVYYEITRDASGQQLVIEKSFDDYGKRLDPIRRQPGYSTTTASEVSEQTTSEFNIAVLWIWTESAECSLSVDEITSGCSLNTTTYNTMSAKIDLAMQQTNMVFNNSNISVTFTWTADRDRSGYNDTLSFGDLLDAAENFTDGILDEIDTLRTNARAALVSVVTSSDASCGVANFPGEFSVNSWDCLTYEYTPAHEFGHNFMCDHDRGEENQCTDTENTWYGYKEPNGLFRTVMSYECDTNHTCQNVIAAGAECVVIPYFSGDSVFNGTVLGINDSPPNDCKGQIIRRAPEIAAIFPPTGSPVTSSPITSAPATASPVTSSPITSAPATASPITSSPITSAPATASPVTSSPITSAPATASPITSSPITASPATGTPTTPAPAQAPTPIGGATASPNFGTNWIRRRRFNDP